MANPADVQKFLSEVTYPASRDDLVAAARNNGAKEDVLDALSSMENREYTGPDDVSSALEE